MTSHSSTGNILLIKQKHIFVENQQHFSTLWGLLKFLSNFWRSSMRRTEEKQNEHWNTHSLNTKGCTVWEHWTQEEKPTRTYYTLHVHTYNIEVPVYMLRQCHKKKKVFQSRTVHALREFMWWWDKLSKLMSSSEQQNGSWSETCSKLSSMQTATHRFMTTQVDFLSRSLHQKTKSPHTTS